MKLKELLFGEELAKTDRPLTGQDLEITWKRTEIIARTLKEAKVDE